jgi:hypothetical protein
MHSSKILLLILVVYLMGFFAHAALIKKTVYGDGIYYYSWLRSIVIDHDIRFGNEYNAFQATQPTTPLGLPGNKYTVGPALLWLPTFAVAHSLIRGTGYEMPYQIAVGLTCVLYAYVGLLLLFFLLSKYFNQTVTTVSILGIAGATNLLFYGSLDVVNSHAVSFFAVSLFLTFLFQKSRSWIFIGTALGLVGLMRTQDLIVGLLVLPYIKKNDIISFTSGLLIVFLPQLLAWQVLYGKFWVSPYISNIEGFNFLQPHLLGVLFAPSNGLLLWTPIVLVGCIGLLKSNTRLPLKLMAGIITLALYLIASWSVWWQGASYSGRMLISILPLVAFGLANLFTIFNLPKLRYYILMFTIVLPLCILNGIMIVYFLLTH